MEIRGEYRLPAPRQAVWDALNDPAVLKQCIPGCESLERDGNRLSARIATKIGPLKASFSGEIRLENVVAPERCSLLGEGRGGIAGFAKGGADIRLAQEGAETVLFYTVNAKIGGMLARFGAGLIEKTAKTLSSRFFDRFAVIVTGDATATARGDAQAVA